MFTPEEIEALHKLLEKTCEEIHYGESEERPYWYDTAKRLGRRFEKLYEFNRKLDDIEYRTMGDQE